MEQLAAHEYDQTPKKGNEVAAHRVQTRKHHQMRMIQPLYIVYISETQHRD